MLADVIERPEVEGEFHRSAVTLAKQRLDIGLEAHALFGAGHRGRSLQCPPLGRPTEPVQPTVAATACSMSSTNRLAWRVKPPAWLASSNRTTVDPARSDMNACTAGSMTRSWPEIAYHDGSACHATG